MAWNSGARLSQLVQQLLGSRGAARTIVAVQLSFGAVIAHHFFATHGTASG